MKSVSLRDQLAGAITSGALVKDAAPRRVRDVASPSAIVKNVPAATHWCARARKLLLGTRSSISIIGKLSSPHSVELLERLDLVANVAERIRLKCATESARCNSRSLVAARRAAETVLNFTKTIAEGASSRDIEASHLAGLSTQLGGFVTALETAVNNVERPPAAKTIEDMMGKDTIQHMAQSEIKLSRAVQQERKHAAFVVHLPVVAVFDGIVTAEALQRVNLPVSKMGGYPILLDQRVLCVRTHMLDSQRDQAEYLRRLLNRLNDQGDTNHKWTMVLDSGVANIKYEIMMYWIMPAKDLDLMLSVAKSVGLREWGLAF